ncbi:MAG: hypothetical protein PHZ09_14270 [Eubacteriales bacterium]|nr:hypothetical protein [Eubacteriales bacterium]
MNKSANRSLTLFLVFALIVPVLLACGETAAPESGETTDTAETTAVYTIPVEDFDGYTYTFFTVDKSQTKLMNLSFVAESMDGEAVNDALYTRNNRIAERYNIEITEETLNQWNLADAVKRSADAGDDVYNLVSFTLLFMVPQAMGGYYLDLNNIQSLDLSQPYWDNSVNESVTLRNHQYFAAGDISIYYKGNIWVYFFNKKMVNDLSLDDPYDLVNGGRWTADTHMTMTKTAVMDLDGNSVLDDADQWGLVTHSSNYSELVYAFGEDFFVKDENDIPVLSMDTPSFSDVFNTILNLNYSETIQPAAYKNTAYTDIFYNNRSLFMAEILAVAEAMRSIDELEFGIIPLPKYNEAQEHYISSSHPTSHLAAIPVTVCDPERTGLITEALAGESTDTLTEAYYENVVKYKLTRDEESIAMLDLILANCTVDISAGLDIGGVVGEFVSMCSRNADNLQSMLSSRADRVAADIEKHFGTGD